jgi:hypothetical protein
MNYLAFAGIAEIDNIFARAQRYLKVKDELIDKVDQYEQDLVEQFLTFKKESKKREDGNVMSSFRNPIPKECSGLMRYIILTTEFLRIIYKGIFFYVFPYFVVVLSYVLYEHSA